MNRSEYHLISEEDIERLVRGAATSPRNAPFLQQTRMVFLRLLIATGARIGEIASVTVESVLDAARMPRPLLKIPSDKVRSVPPEKAYRLAPIDHHLLKFICAYIEQYRAPVIKQCLGKTGDHGVLLISGITGRPITGTEVSLELQRLRPQSKKTRARTRQITPSQVRRTANIPRPSAAIVGSTPPPRLWYRAKRER